MSSVPCGVWQLAGGLGLTVDQRRAPTLGPHGPRQQLFDELLLPHAMDGRPQLLPPQSPVGEEALPEVLSSPQ